MLLRSIPPEHLNHNEIIKVINERVPDIDLEVKRRYVRDVSHYQIAKSERIRWYDWTTAVKAAENVEIDEPYLEARRAEILEDVYYRYIHPYACQFKMKAHAMAEAYLVCVELCKNWRISEDQMMKTLKFQEVWDEEIAKDKAKLPQN